MSMSDWDFIDVANIFARQGTCSRLQVGALLVEGKRIISTGYNGAPAGMSHCYHQEGDDRPCHKAVHAEANVIAFAARKGVSTFGSTLYTTHMPCSDCAKLIINAGISKVVYDQEYRSAEGEQLLAEAGIEVKRPF
jgi:dCMP deaminase